MLVHTSFGKIIW